ncbi:MAG: chemotaxis protein CheW [Spirulinaceae cyanobacterium SM2_1_0]|nr:chemotaxis protein CheW [Spirulinaceae cyanobacterium SM2_1_0]
MNSVAPPPLTAATDTYLTVNLGASLYGIDSLAVEEVLLLPELTPLAMAPLDWVGVVNLRGTLLPVIDLHLSWGYQPLPYCLTDNIVVLNWQQQRLGLLVNQVRDVRVIAPSTIEQPLQATAGDRPADGFSQGVARSDDEIIILLSAAALAKLAAGLERALVATPDLATSPAADLAEPRRFWPSATPAEREVLQRRATSLRAVHTDQDSQGFLPLAVLRWGDEVFAIDLRLVREFAELRAIAPVPCCPPHIVGNTNLRGEIVTLIDISAWLQLPLRPRPSTLKVGIVQVDDLIVGILVDEVLDVLRLDPAQISSPPTALNVGSEDYLQGAAPYGDR